MPSRQLIFHSYGKKTRFPQKKVLLLSSFWKLEFLELGIGLLALTLAISTSVQCNVILWVGYLFIYLYSNTNPFLLFSDIDECSIGAFKCRIHTECINTIGSYTCKCKQGFYSNGPHCLGKNFQVCACSSQLLIWKRQIQKKKNSVFIFFSFSDFNECLRGSADCHEDAWCTNTAGSYKCFCKEGYHGNGTSCEKWDLRT